MMLLAAAGRTKNELTFNTWQGQDNHRDNVVVVDGDDRPKGWRDPNFAAICDSRPGKLHPAWMTLLYLSSCILSFSESS